MFAMIFDIFSDHVCRNLVTDRTHKISIFPKLSAPKLFLYLRMLLKNYAGTDALEHPYYLGNTVPRRKRQKNVNMIFRYLHRVYLKVMIPGNLLKNILYSLSDISSQNPFAILRRPYQMVFRIIDRMASSLQFRAISITSPLPSAGELFIPVYKTGYSSSNFA